MFGLWISLPVLDLEMDLVNVRLALTPALDGDKAGLFQFGDQLGDT